MKILQVTPTYPPAWSFGGISRLVYEISLGLCNRGHEVEIWTSDALDWYSRVKRIDMSTVRAGAKVCYFKNLSLSLNRILNFHITRGMFIYTKRVYPIHDIAHFHGARTFQNIVGYNYVKKHGVPYVFQAHGSLLRTKTKQRMKWIYDVLFGYKMLRDAAKVIALSSLEAKQYRLMGVPEEKIEIIPNGIDLSKYDDLPLRGYFRKKFGLDKDEKIVLYVGRVHESKGLDLLAKAFQIVSKEFKNIRLVILGPFDGYETTLSKIISELGIKEKVLLTGFVEKKDKLAALVDGDVFVTPNFSGFPIAFLEACFAKCPIITTTEELEWIHDNVGIITKPSTVELADAIRKILQDNKLRKRLEKNCKSTLEKFDIACIVSMLEEVYKEITIG